MLRVGLTGGIGAGKSTVSRLLTGLGAVLVDADVLAREVVAPGTPGLAAVVAEFGSGVLAADGALDRPALGRVVFADPRRRAALNAIVHPLVAARRRELRAAAAEDAVVVEDVPLLVETGAAPGYPLVVVVDADAAERERRLVAERGMDPADARARIAAQAGDGERRAAADVLLPNPRREPGRPDPLPALVERLWRERLLPFEAGLRAGRPGPVPDGEPTAADARRVLARLEAAAGRARLEQAASWPLRARVPAEGGLASVGYVGAGPGRFASADPGCAVVVDVEGEVAGAARVGGRA
ncbi:dephospho-CoA kinase [Kineococcus sp. SYSU DK001]|uniref:dephospho-CoA kinase n=1 Tax=Kineococcus sp. SYSU DK001 TaxID=3383122 RepID=UPI003D7D9D8C